MVVKVTCGFIVPPNLRVCLSGYIRQWVKDPCAFQIQQRSKAGDCQQDRRFKRWVKKARSADEVVYDITWHQPVMTLMTSLPGQLNTHSHLDPCDFAQHTQRPWWGDLSGPQGVNDLTQVSLHILLKRITGWHHNGRIYNSYKLCMYVNVWQL